MTAGPEGPLADPGAGGRTGSPLGRLAEDPAKVMRIGTSILRLLDEVHNAPLDDARARLAHVHQRSVEELQDGLAPGPAEELRRLWQPLTSASSASEEELRIGQAQLSGWIGGLVQDIQSTIEAKQAATRQLLEPVQPPLPDPPGSMPTVVLDSGPLGQSGGREQNPADDVELPGQYL
ncbi:proteasome activator [Arthrobacter sp. ZGTC412]|uniref:proteasome activator n=1 Tax=Arthrobacter sp. ZGTC412 TaxID=2058900 RepID=UPI000CE35E92|nr:proteasome activator [Arthrobacter sp. ZGTC412]